MSWQSTPTNIWSADLTAQNATAWTDGVGNVGAVALPPGGTAVLQIKFTCGSAADLYFRILGSLDGGATWDTVPFIQGAISRVAGSIERRSVVIFGLKHFKVQYMGSATDTGYGVQAAYVMDGISL